MEKKIKTIGMNYNYLYNLTRNENGTIKILWGKKWNKQAQKWDNKLNGEDPKS